MIEKLGLFFDIEKLPGPESGVLFAQGPKVLLFEEFSRVYYSCRRPPENGKYLSIIQYADFLPDFSKVIAFSESEIVVKPELGTFDEHGIFPMDVVRVGGELWGYSGGWTRRSSVSIDMSIGRLTSRNEGLTFERDGPGPVLTRSVAEPFLVGDPSVIVLDGLLHMFYIRGTSWTPTLDGVPERTYLIAHRVSLDGRSWVPAPGGNLFPVAPRSDWEAQAMPSVIRVDNTFVMFFSYRDTFGFRDNPENAYRLGAAFSTDLYEWTRIELDFHDWRGDWDAEMMAYPNVHVRDGSIYVLYNGNEFGRYGFGGVRFDSNVLLSLAQVRPVGEEKNSRQGPTS